MDDTLSCSACAQPLATTGSYVRLPCLHVLCGLCLEAERRDQPGHQTIACVSPVEHGLACGERFVPSDDADIVWAQGPTAPAAAADAAPTTTESNESVDQLDELAKEITFRLTFLKGAIGDLDEALDRLRRHRDDTLRRVDEHFRSISVAMANAAHPTTTLHKPPQTTPEPWSITGVVGQFFSSLWHGPPDSPDDDTTTTTTTTTDTHIAFVEQILQACSQRCRALQAEFDSTCGQVIPNHVKTLSDQRDNILVLRNQYEAALGALRSGQQYVNPIRRLLSRVVPCTLLADFFPVVVMDEYWVPNALQEDTAMAVARRIQHMGCVRLSRLTTRSGSPRMCLPWCARGYGSTLAAPPVAHQVDLRGERADAIVWPSALAWDLHGNITVADANGYVIQANTPNGEFVRTISRGMRAVSVATTILGDIWAADNHANQVVLVNGETGVLGRSVVCDKPCGLSLAFGSSQTENALICVHSMGRRVTMFNVDGSMQWQSKASSMYSNLEVGHVSGTCLSGSLTIVPEERTVILCDSANDRLVVLFLPTGQYLGSIGGLGQLRHPKAVTYDPVARLLIVGEAHQLSVWTLGGTKVYEWTTIGHAASIQSLAISPVDSTIAACDRDHLSLLVF